MADKKFTLVFDANMDVSKVKKSVSEIQSALNGLNLSKGMASSASGTFKKLLEELDNYNNLTSQAATSMADIKKADKSLQSILALFDKINNITEEVGANPINFINPAELKKINAAKKALESAKQAMSNTAVAAKKANLQDQFDKAKKKVDDLNNQVGQLNNKISSKKAAKTSIETSLEKAREDLTQLRKELASLEANPVKAETKTTSKKGVKTTENLNAQEVENYKNKLNETKAKISETERAITQLNKDLQSTDTSKMEEELEQIEQRTKEATQAMNELGEKLKHVGKDNRTEAIKKLRDELADLTGKAKKDIPQTIDKIEEFVESLSEAEKVKVAEALNKMNAELAETARESKNAANGLDKTTKEAEQLSRTAQDIEHLKNQVFDFFSVSNTIQIFKNSVRDAINTVKELDAAMTETAVVTDFSIGDMWDKLPEYSEQATKLGTSIKSLYEATTLYYQQGLNSEQAMGVGVETMKMARIAGMDAADATTAMTAALRGFNMEINEMSATRVNDVYSELAAITAADTEQIATAMSKTASIAASANMEFETTAALLAQIIETTQEAPETAGTAMKTIIARFTEVKKLFDEGMLTGEDEEGEIIDINKIDTALKTVGISLKDFLNGAKGIDDIFLELASKWDTLDIATQRYIATTAAGSRQQSRFLAMMSNYDRTMELVNAATDSAGASQNQFGKTLDSLEAKLQKLKNAWDTFVMGLADSEIVKGGVDLLTLLLEVINKLTSTFDGIGGSVAKIGLVIAALKTGKGLFNVLTGKAYSAGAQVGTNFTTGLIASIKDIPIEQVSTNLQTNLKGMLSGTVAWSNGLLALGMGLKFVAQQLENTGLEKYTDLISNAGTAVLVFSGALKILTPMAAAANQTVWQLIASIVGGIGPIGWAVAAVTALGGALAYIAYQNTPEQVLKRTQKYAEEAGNAAEKAAQKYNELQNSLAQLQNSETTLNDMTVGTQEWRDAVVNLNNEILKLIEAYPELKELVNFENGHLTIDYESEKGQEITKQLHSQVVAKQIASIAADASVVKQEERTYYYDNIYGFNPLVSQTGAIEDLANAIYRDYSSFDTREEIIEWLNNNNLKQFAADERAVDSLYNNNQKLYNYGEHLEGNQDKYNTYSALAQSSLISKMDTDEYSSRVIDLLGKIQVPVQEYADGWRENSQVNKSNYQEVGKVLAESLYGEGATASLNNWTNEVTLSNKEGTESTKMPFDRFKDQAAYYKGAKQATKQLEEAASLISNMSEEKQIDLGKILSLEGQELDLTTLKDINLAGGVEQYISSNFGADVVQKFEKVFGMSFESVEENMRIAMERLNKERGALVKKMSKYSSKDLQGFEINADILAGLELKFGEKIHGILDGVLTSLEATGDEALISQGFEQFREIAMMGTESEFEELTSFVEDINWSNPIDAVHKLNQEVETGSELTQKYAQNILDVGSSFLGAGSQMQYFFKTEEYAEVKESLDDIIAKNNEISAADVLDLADEYKSLNKILENTDVTAGGLAKTLELIAKGELGMHQLTDTVMAVLEGFDSLDSMVAQTLKTLSEFDPGMDENEVSDFINAAYETISKNLKAGAVGNSQNFSYLDFMFPGWDKGLEGDALVKQMEYLTGKLEDNSTNMRHAWSDLAAGKDVYGEAITFEEGSKWGPNDLNIDDTGSSIKLTGWEDKGMTTQDMVDWISDAYNVSDNYAKMMLADFKNYSANLAKELNANDYTAGIKKAKEELETVTVGDPITRAGVDKKIIDESEIQAIATLYNKTIKDVRAEFSKEEGYIITNFYDKNGLLRQSSELITELDKIAQSGGAEGATWAKRFIDSAGKLDVTKLNQSLSEVGIPESAKAGITQDIIDSMRAAETDPVEIKVTLSNGSVQTIPIEPQIDVQTAIANAETELANSKLAEAIAGAFKNITFSPGVDGKKVTDSVIAAIKAADGTAVIIAPNQDSINTITSEINAAAQESSPIAYVFGNVQNVIDKVANLKLSTECIVTYVEGNSPPGGEQGGNEGSGEVGPNAAAGIKKATYSGITLVSEEGPELIQKADGGAYLSGTNGPEMVNIEHGDTVYTADQTKEIFKKRNHAMIPRYAEGYNYGDAYSGGSGGRSSDNDEETWENPFDKLYNLVRKIDEELRQRERIERRYEKLLENINVSANKLIEISREELAHLEQERILQEQLVAGREYQISEYQKENSDLLKYAQVTQNERGEDVLRIDWKAINAITDPEEGQRVEDYVTQLEDWFNELVNARKDLEDIEDTVEEIKERGEDQYFNLEESIKEALVKSYQDEIDKLSEINNSINDTNASLLDAMQKTIEKQRQDRENQRTEDDLAEKQRRLLYLQQDTSGANAMEILTLQEEIARGQEDYTDSLIDQKISELQDQNDEAAKQREQQITIMQSQLDHYIDTGKIWDEVYSLMDSGMDPDTGLIRGSRLEEILKNSENFAGLSAIGQQEWWKDWNNMIAQALLYLETGRQLEDIGVSAGSEIEFTTSDGRTLTGTVNADGSVTTSDGQTYNNVFQGYDGKYYAGENISDVEPPRVEDPAEGQGEETTPTPSKENNYTEDNIIGIAEAIWLKGDLSGWGYGSDRKNRIDQKIGSGAGNQVQGRIDKIAAKKLGVGKAKKDLSEYYYTKFKTGGLADFTGPAWLDGTKARPELVLNAKDTQNFIQLKNILASIMERGSTSNTSTENNGDITYDIDINVESIGSDYDVEQVANKVKSLIGENARYRNNNTVSLSR